MMRAFVPMIASVCGIFLCSESAVARDVTRYPKHRPEFSANIVGGFSGLYRDILPLETQLGLDPTFNEQQQELIEEAMKIFMKRAVKDQTISCAFRRASKDFPVSAVKFTAQMLSGLTLIDREEMMVPSFVFIGRYWDDAKAVGIAYKDLFYEKDFPFPGFEHRHYFHVALNSDFLGDGSDYKYRNDVNYWAGVLAHEFLHNLGYDHPTGYPGSFIREYQYCITNDGLEGAPLEGEVFDKVVEREQDEKDL